MGVVMANPSIASAHMQDEQCDGGSSDVQSEECFGMSLLQRHSTMVGHNETGTRRRRRRRGDNNYCWCVTPNAGTAHHNEIRCKDYKDDSDTTAGYTLKFTYCASDEECYRTDTFVRDYEPADVCRIPDPPYCICKTPGQGTVDKNEFECTDGSSAWCASNEECYNGNAWTKGEWGDG